MNAVVVEGISMRPYLVSGDVLVVKEIDEPLTFGSLVLVQTDQGERIVHRYLGAGKIKGDRVKVWDRVKKVDYLVVARIDRDAKVDLTPGVVSFSLATLSYLNQKKFPLVHHVAAGLIAILGRWGRHGT